MQPVIGVIRGARLRDTYRRALEAAGAAVVEIASGEHRGRTAADDPQRALDGLHGLLLTGGGDVDPALYGATTAHPTVSVEGGRDVIELALVRAAISSDLPLLGICRGIQSLNVALGGSLWQDLPSEHPSPVVHKEAGEDRDRRRLLHSVEVAPDNLLARVIETRRLEVNSIHHQAIRGLAPRLRAIAAAPDGVIEAVDAPGHRFVLGVQWHPEDLWEVDDHHRALFAAFCEAARSQA